MAYIQQKEEQSSRGVTLAERVKELEERDKISKRQTETTERTKEFKFPFRWRFKLRSAKKKRYNDMILVFFLNKKNQIEPPKFMPIFDGNMIVWKNKPYEFDPRAVWTVQGMKGNPQAYFIKEIDRRPIRNKKGKPVYIDAAVSNLDIDEIRARGDSTESDEFLIKAALKAQTTQMKKGVNIALIVIVALIAVGGLIWFLVGG